jgi:hypothetical protein
MKTAVLFGIVLLSASPSNQQNISGRWVVTQDRDFRGNRGRPADCAFTQRRQALTVRCSAAGQMTGQVNGTHVTWSIDMTDIPPVVKDHVILTYSGALNGAGDTIEGSWTLRSRQSEIDERGTFQARRKSSSR